jgi:hypothetical protein
LEGAQHTAVGITNERLASVFAELLAGICIKPDFFHILVPPGALIEPCCQQILPVGLAECHSGRGPAR